MERILIAVGCLAILVPFYGVCIYVARCKLFNTFQVVEQDGKGDVGAPGAVGVPKEMV